MNKSLFVWLLLMCVFSFFLGFSQGDCMPYWLSRWVQFTSFLGMGVSAIGAMWVTMDLLFPED